MTCNHPRKWEMTQEYTNNLDGVAVSSELIEKVLSLGWEPFAVTQNVNFRTTYFRRLKPCTECAEKKV